MQATERHREDAMMWYNNPSAVQVITEAKRERSRSRSNKGLRLISSR
jgi:hypothetical protein